MYIQDSPRRPLPDQLRRLRAHVPYSLSLLRRLQVANGALESAHDDSDDDSDDDSLAASATAHIIFVYDADSEQAVDAHTPFAAAHVDLMQAPESAAVVYATDQDGGQIGRPASFTGVPSSAEARARALRLLMALLRHIRAMAAALFADAGRRAVVAERVAALAGEQMYLYAGDVAGGGDGLGPGVRTSVKVNLHDGLLQLLQEAGVTVAMAASYDKWLVPVGGAIAATATEADNDDDSLLVNGTRLRWDAVRRADVPLVVSRTSIPRSEAALLYVPSLGLRVVEAAEEAVTPAAPLIAWAFLGTDGSIWTLHCEEAFRGRGLAKALAARLLRQRNRDFGRGDDSCDSSDGNLHWATADVSATNKASQAVMRSLGGQQTWSTSWTVICFDSLDATLSGGESPAKRT